MQQANFNDLKTSEQYTPNLVAQANPGTKIQYGEGYTCWLQEGSCPICGGDIVRHEGQDESAYNCIDPGCGRCGRY